MGAIELTADLFAELDLDVAKITGPLPGGSGGGVDIRYTPEFDALAQARREEDAGEQGIWQVEIKKADWRLVASMASDILSTKSKDLQVAVWLVQALYNLHGLKGLAAGLAIVARMVKTLWPLLWPQIDGDDVESRLAPFFWIDSRLTEELTKMTVTEPLAGEVHGFTFQQVLKARELERMARNRPGAFEAALAEGEISESAINMALARTSTEFLVDHYGEARLAVSATKRLSDALDAAAGKESPSFKAFRQTLNEIDRLFTQALADRNIKPDVPAEKPAAKDPPSKEKTVPASSSRTEIALTADGMPVIKDRRQAYAVLKYVAEWLAAQEPHSPAPSLVRRAVSWESMTLGDVLLDLRANGTDLDVALKVLGITSDEGGPQNTVRRR